MAPFQAKVGWKSPRKQENKKFSFHFVPTRHVIENSKKIAKKFKKLKKIPSWIHFNPKQVGKVQEGEKIKIIVPFHSYPTRNGKFQKNCKN